MKKGLQSRWLALLSAVVVAMLLEPVAYGAEASPSAVSVKAILPENQIGDVSYFDLQMSPGDTQTVQLRINNAEDRPVRASVELNPASTGLGGTIIYTQTDSRDESMAYSIGDIASVREATVEIPAKSSAMVDVEIAMPDEEISGVILGGLRVTSDYSEPVSDESSRQQGIQIENRFAYVIGLKVSQSPSEAGPDFHLKGIRTGLVNYSPAVLLNIQNSQPAIAKEISFSARVYAKGSSDVLRELVKDNAEMAPNSSCDYVVDWANTKIQPGTYRLLARMQYGDRVWEWDEEFTVNAEEADGINSGALGTENETGAQTWLPVVGGLLLLLLIILAFLLGRRTKKQEQGE